MEAKVQKWGNSLALRIPKAFAQDMNIHQEALVDLSIEAGRLVVTPITEQEYSLDNLLEQVTDGNIHQEIDFGNSVGKEVW